MIYEHFRSTGAHDAVEGLSDLFTQSLQNDDVQDSDVRCDQALLCASDMPSDVILEGLYKSKSQNSAQLQIVFALYDQETARNNGKPNYHMDDSCKTSFCLDDETFKLQGLERCCGMRISHQESKKERKPSLRGKWESVFS